MSKTKYFKSKYYGEYFKLDKYLNTKDTYGTPQVSVFYFSYYFDTYGNPTSRWSHQPIIVASDTYISIKPKLYYCKKCNNNGCSTCKTHPFSVWNKFNGYN